MGWCRSSRCNTGTLAAVRSWTRWSSAHSKTDSDCDGSQSTCARCNSMGEPPTLAGSLPNSHCKLHRSDVYQVNDRGTHVRQQRQLSNRRRQNSGQGVRRQDKGPAKTAPRIPGHDHPESVCRCQLKLPAPTAGLTATMLTTQWSSVSLLSERCFSSREQPVRSEC